MADILDIISANQCQAVSVTVFEASCASRPAVQRPTVRDRGGSDSENSSVELQMDDEDVRDRSAASKIIQRQLKTRKKSSLGRGLFLPEPREPRDVEELHDLRPPTPELADADYRPDQRKRREAAARSRQRVYQFQVHHGKTVRVGSLDLPKVESLKFRTCANLYRAFAFHSIIPLSIQTATMPYAEIYHEEQCGKAVSQYR